MKKLFVVGLVGAMVIAGVVLTKGAAAVTTPEGRACARMGALCETDPYSGADLDACVADMKKARKLAGEANFERSAKCADEATSCAAAAGCYAGGVGVGAVGEMMKGFGTALSK